MILQKAQNLKSCDRMDIIFIESQSYSSNSIILDGKELIVIDPGMQGEMDIFYHLEDHSLSKDDVAKIILTHCHYDHAEAALAFNCPIYAFGTDAMALKEGDDERTAANVFNEHLHIPNIKLLKEKSIEGFQVLHTPGHTDGSICLHDGQYLISGDTVFSEGFGRYDYPSGSKEELKQSLIELSRIDFETLLSGHGPIGGKDSILDALEMFNLL